MLYTVREKEKAYTEDQNDPDVVQPYAAYSPPGNVKVECCATTTNHIQKLGIPVSLQKSAPTGVSLHPNTLAHNENLFYEAINNMTWLLHKTGLKLSYPRGPLDLLHPPEEIRHAEHLRVCSQRMRNREWLFLWCAAVCTDNRFTWTPKVTNQVYLPRSAISVKRSHQRGLEATIHGRRFKEKIIKCDKQCWR